MSACTNTNIKCGNCAENHRSYYEGCPSTHKLQLKYPILIKKAVDIQQTSSTTIPTTINEEDLYQKIMENVLHEMSQRITTLFNTFQNQLAQQIQLLTLMMATNINNQSLPNRNDAHPVATHAGKRSGSIKSDKIKSKTQRNTFKIVESRMFTSDSNALTDNTK
ncbi:hypothetical protein ACOME3_007118 [Neoechinorhynchus agilis]